MFHLKLNIITYIIHSTYIKPEFNTSNNALLKLSVEHGVFFLPKTLELPIHHNFSEIDHQHNAVRARTRPGINYLELRPGCNARVMELQT